MQCQSICSGKIKKSIDLRPYRLYVDFKNPKYVTKAAIQLYTGEDWDMEYLIRCLKDHHPADILLYGVAYLSPGDSKSEVIPEDCILLETSNIKHSAEPSAGDTSMPVMFTDNTTLRLCFSGSTFIRIVGTDNYIKNNKGVIEVGKRDARTDIFPADGIVVEF